MFTGVARCFAISLLRGPRSPKGWTALPYSTVTQNKQQTKGAHLLANFQLQLCMLRIVYEDLARPDLHRKLVEAIEDLLG